MCIRCRRIDGNFGGRSDGRTDKFRSCMMCRRSVRSSYMNICWQKIDRMDLREGKPLFWMELLPLVYL